MKELLCAAIAVAVLAAPWVRAQDAGFQRRINAMVDRAATALAGAQREDGSFPEDTTFPTGRTALATFALLHAGYGRDHEVVTRAVAWLGYDEPRRKVAPRTIYEASCHVLMLNAHSSRHAKTIRLLCDWIVDRFDETRGLWAYPTGHPDMSNTQFAVLAIKAAERHGYKAPRKVWKRLVDGILALQARDGGFRYNERSLPSATMTHAALQALLFARQALGGKLPRKLGRTVDGAMRRGHGWLEAGYRIDRAPVGRGHYFGLHHHYYLYGLERYGVFFSKKKMAGHDWYREGAELLLATREKNGAWGRVEDTAFAILFLRKVTFTDPEPLPPVDPEAADEEPAPIAATSPPKPYAGVPHLRDWLIAGPFETTPLEDDMLVTKHFDMRTVKVKNGQRVGPSVWKRFRFDEDRIDVRRATGGGEYAAYYAACRLHAEKPTPVWLWLGCDDGYQVWLDGRKFSESNHFEYSGDDHFRIPLMLRRGSNLLILRVANAYGECYFGARLTGRKGGPPVGVRASVRD